MKGQSLVKDESEEHMNPKAGICRNHSSLLKCFGCAVIILEENRPRPFNFTCVGSFNHSGLVARSCPS